MIENFFNAIVSGNWEKSLLKLAEKEGREEGALGLPTDTTKKYSVGETNVRVKIKTQYSMLQAKLTEKVKEILPKIEEKSSAIEAAELAFSTRRSASMLRIVLDGELESNRRAFEDAAYRKHSSEGQYKKFKGENQIEIEPDHPSPAEKVNLIWWALFLVTLETVFNAFFWGKQVEGDNVAALGLAAFLAILNVAFAFSAGIALAYKNIKVYRTPALVGFLTLFGFVLVIIGVIVNYRMTYLSDDRINAIQNLLVAAYGLLFAGIAAWKGYKLNGTYPGYKAASTQYLNAMKAISDLSDSVRRTIFRETSADEDARQKADRDIAAARVYLAKVKSDLEAIGANYRAAIKHLNGVMENAILVFREVNTATKASALENPAWFNEPVEGYSTESPVFEDALTELNLSSEKAALALDGIREVSRQELVEIIEIRSKYGAEQLSALVSSADRVGLEKYKAEIAEGIGNHGLGRDTQL